MYDVLTGAAIGGLVTFVIQSMIYGRTTAASFSDFSARLAVVEDKLDAITQVTVRNNP